MKKVFYPRLPWQRIMQLTALPLVLIFLVATFSLAEPGHAQQLLDRPVTIQVSGQDLKSILAQLERLTNSRFVYRPALVRTVQPIRLTARNERLASVLDRLLKPLGISYDVSNEYIILNRATVAPSLAPTEPKAALESPLNPALQLAETTVTGRITDEKGEPLPGVNIAVKGTSRGTSANGEGRYSLVVNPTDVLIFSFIGFQKKEVSVDNRTVIDVSLTAENTSLDEVVVVGYGTQRKIETTGSIASIKAAELLQTPVANVAQGLQARVAGMQITQNSGAPGGNVSVRIRGTNSINGSSEPLYVIDGIQIANGGGVSDVSPLSQINPNDIESIDVLKDASSTAIYGSRAANGVVLITTKRGKDGLTRVSYDGYAGVQQVNKTIDVLNARQFAALENEVYKRPIYANPTSLGDGFDWQKLIFRQARMQSHQLSVTGGNQKTQLAVSLNYFNQDGIVRNSNFTRYSLRSNLDHTISKRVRIGTSLYYGYTVNNGVTVGGISSDVTSSRGGVLGAAVAAPPTLVPYREDGTIFPFQDQMNGQYQEVTNPLNFITPLNQQSAQRLLVNAYIDFTLLKGLTYRASFNADVGSTLGEFYSPLSLLSKSQLASGGGTASNTNTYGRTLLHESIFTYRTRLAERHTLAATVVLASQAEVGQVNSQSARNFPNDVTQNNAIQLAVDRTVSSNKSKSRLDSYLGRVNYGYRDRYFLDLTARVDGATKFGENNKYGFFPAIAGAWRIVEEPFMKSLPVISDLKLRGSWGITGNAGAIGPYQSLATVSASGLTYNFNHNTVNGINPGSIPNPNLRWEKSTQIDIGLDISLFKNRLSVVADYYSKQTDDLLFQKALPQSSGYSAITGNYGSIRNRGVELALSGRIVPGSGRALQWDASANITVNQNEVLALDGVLQELPRSEFALLKIGYPMGLYRTYLFDGITQTGESILPGYDGRVGGPKVKDVNGDGKISAADQMIVGNAQPKYLFGVSSSWRFRGFDLSLFLQGVQGISLLNLFRYTFETPLGQQNLLAGTANRWSPTNPNNEYALGFQGGRLPLSDRYVENASFVRLKNVTLGYTLPKLRGINQMRVYVSANNALTFTNYTGFDPEVNNFGNSTTLFIDNGTYPIARSYLGGLQVSF